MILLAFIQGLFIGSFGFPRQERTIFTESDTLYMLGYETYLINKLILESIENQSIETTGKALEFKLWVLGDAKPYTKLAKYYEDKNNDLAEVLDLFNGVIRALGNRIPSMTIKKQTDILSTDELAYFERYLAVGQVVEKILNDLLQRQNLSQEELQNLLLCLRLFQ